MTAWWRTGLPGAIGNQSPESPGEVSLLMVAGDPGAHFACAARAAARATYGLAGSCRELGSAQKVSCRTASRRSLAPLDAKPSQPGDLLLIGGATPENGSLSISDSTP